ncbi:MAG: urea carboxylase-associated family protein [Myxococcota bacterium]|nr:urea carboxylase-associated family protein [Myxococcota bacterium]
MSDTSTPLAAREHARAQAESEAARVLAKPTIPATDAKDLPAGVDASEVVWDQVLGPGDYASAVLERGSRLRLLDLEGDASVSLLAYNADDTQERINTADTVKVQWQAYLGEGSLLLSDMGRVLLSILEDGCGHHDTFCGASSERSNAARYGHGGNHGPHPNARDRFTLALTKHGLGKRDLCPNVNLFKGVRVDDAGNLLFEERAPAPGQALTLRAEMRVLVVLVNAPHVLDPRPEYTATPVRVTAWAGELAPLDDPVRNSSPERLRAFENVEAYYAGTDVGTSGGPHGG